MGQAFRRASGKLRTTSIDTQSPAPQYQKPVDRTPPVVPTNDKVHLQNKDSASVEEGNSSSNAKVMEERDPSYEAMLSQMVGKISTKPGGKLEMGEAFVVQKTKRPMPKVRNTTPETGRYEERPVAAGTLNIAQLRHIMRLSQSKEDEHSRSRGLKEISECFQVDAVHLEKIFQHLSLPPEDNTSRTKHESEN
ncbi:Protein split ends [Bienertia sinuspersici]